MTMDVSNATKPRRRRAWATVIVAAALVGVTATTSACSPRMFGAVAAAAIVTAAIVGTAHVLAYHDAHWHNEYCGHRHRWHDGRAVYYYHDHWEYYDPYDRRWYYYAD